MHTAPSVPHPSKRSAAVARLAGKESDMIIETSPAMKRAVAEALKKMDTYFDAKTPRKTPEQAKAEHEAWKKKSMADVKIGRAHV